MSASNERPMAGVRANLRLDLRTAELAIPSGRLVIPLAAIVIAAGFGFVRPGYNSSYGESLLLIVLLCAFGALGRTLGAAAVLAFAVADFARFLVGTDRYLTNPTPQDTVGRVVTYGVLWLLVVYVPSIARRVEWAAETRRNLGLVGRFIASAIGAAVAGLGAYLWAFVMPYLFRSAYRGSPDPATLQPQQHPELLALGVAAAYFGVVVFLRRGPVSPVELEPLLGALRRTGVLGLIVRIVGFGVVVLGLSGILSGTFDAAVLAAGFVIAEVAAWIVGRWGLLGITNHRSPALIGAAGAVLSFAALLLVGWAANAVWPQGLFLHVGQGVVESKFWPIIVSLAVAWPIARIGLSLGARAKRDGGSADVHVPAAAALGAAGLLVVGVLAAMLLFPAVAFADNCGNLSDCFYMAFYVATMGGFGAGLLAAADYLSPEIKQPPKSNVKGLGNYGEKADKPQGTSDRFNNILRGGKDMGLY